MRIERAIDAFLDWRRIERDATPRSVDSYQRILFKLAEDYPEVDLAKLTTADLRTCLKRWEKTSTSTRSNVISVIHSFFRWANEQDMIPHDPSAKIRRPPKRKPDRYRPTSDELARIQAGRAKTGHTSRSRRTSWRSSVHRSGTCNRSSTTTYSQPRSNNGSRSSSEYDD